MQKGANTNAKAHDRGGATSSCQEACRQKLYVKEQTKKLAAAAKEKRKRKGDKSQLEVYRWYNTGVMWA